MNVVTKSVDAEIKPVESDHPNGMFRLLLSTEDIDRDDENLWIKEWKQPFPKRIQIDGDHSRSIEKTVGSVVPRIEGNQVIGEGPYASTPYAQTIRQILNDKDAEGHGIGVSVTYRETKDKSGNIQRELLNAALVAVPANPNCVVLSSKSVQELHTESVKPGEVSLKADGGLSASGDNPQVPPKHDAMVQAIHDAACHLGAQCLNEIDADPGTADGANKRLEDVAALVKTGLITATEARESFDLTDKSSSPEAGPPEESAEESAAAAKAAAADESADDTATQAKAAEMKARAIAFLISKNSSKEQ